MARLGWSPEARRDLRRIRQWIAQDSPHYAALMVERIRVAVQRLRRFPESGRTLPELPNGPYREVIVSPYRVIYRYEREIDTVAIVSVIHGRQRLPSLA